MPAAPAMVGDDLALMTMVMNLGPWPAKANACVAAYKCRSSSPRHAKVLFRITSGFLLLLVLTGCRVAKGAVELPVQAVSAVAGGKTPAINPTALQVMLQRFSDEYSIRTIAALDDYASQTAAELPDRVVAERIAAMAQADAKSVLNHAFLLLAALNLLILACVGHPPDGSCPELNGLMSMCGWKRRRDAALFSLMVLAALRIQEAESRAADAGSDYVVTAWDIGEGLPDSTVTAIAQAPDGYLWLGTFNGLVQFDGRRFKVLNPDNTPELPSAGIVNLHWDRRGRLWVSTIDGLSVREGGRWRALGGNEGWAGNYVRTFAERDNGDLLLTTFDGHVLVFENDRLAELPEPPGGERGHGYLGTVDEQGRWWVVQNRFVGYWDGGQWVQVRTPDPAVGRSAVAGAQARGGGVWVLLGKELFGYRDGREVSRRLLPELRGGVWFMREDSQSNLWICSYDFGLFQLLPGGEVHHWTVASGLGYPTTRVVFEDHEGNLWVGTNGGGLRRFRARRFTDMGAGSRLEGRAIRSVATARDQGLWVVSPDLGLFRHDGDGLSTVPVPGPDAKRLYGQSVLEDAAGRGWYGDPGGCWWRQGSGTFELAPLGLPGEANVAALFEDSLGRVWIAAGDRVVLFDGQNFRALGSEEGLPPGQIFGFGEAETGVIWLAGATNVFRHEQDRWVEVRHQGESLEGVLCFKGDVDGTMWMGTRRDGLLRWRLGKLDRVGVAQGLPDREIRGMQDDEAGCFWMPSNRGIIRVNLDQLHQAADGHRSGLESQLLDSEDGLPGVAFPTGQPISARDSSGRLWFATQRGLVRVDPARFRLNTNSPPVVIEQFSYRARSSRGATGRGDAMSGEDPSVAGPFSTALRLPPGNRWVEIEYTALSFAAPDKVRFQFKLEGQSADWEDAQQRRSLRFHQLPPADYIFHVRAANNDGVWNQTGAQLAFSVLPQYWQTWWFRAGLAVVLFNLGGAAVWWRSRWRVRRALERERTADEIRDLAGRLINAQEDERRRIARELHDDFSQRLALLSVEMELADGATAETTPRLAGMATRVKELSTEVHRMAYELHPAKLDQLGLVAAGRGFCRELALQSGVRITFEPGECPRELRPELALCLYRVLQESLHNVINHSGATEARVELCADRNRVRLVVSDNGRGFDVDRAKREGGLGLSSMCERVRLVRGSLGVESHGGRGARVEVWAPLN